MPRYIVQMRRGSSTQWADSDIIPLEGELVVEIDEDNGLHKLKIGDGRHLYSELAYLKAGDEIVTQVLAEAKPRVVTVELAATWTKDADDKYSQVINIDGITGRSRLDLQPSVDMLAEFKQLGLVFVTENSGGRVTVYSVGNMPSKAYTMQATIVETECNNYDDPILGIPIGSGSAAQRLDDYATKEFVNNKDTSDYYTNNTPTLTALGGIAAGTTFENMKVTEILDKLLYSYVEPSVGVLTLNPSKGVKKYGTELKVETASVTVTKKTNDIVSVALYKNNTEKEKKVDGVAGGGTFTFNIDETLNGMSDVTYKVEVSDGRNTVSTSASYSFVHPYYHGIVSEGTTINPDVILGLTEDVSAKGSKTYTYTTDDQCPVIAYLASYGALKSIIDPQGYNQGWPQTTIKINGVDYYVYVGGAATAENVTYKFNY